MEFLNSESILTRERNLIYEPDAEISAEIIGEKETTAYDEKPQNKDLGDMFFFEPQSIKIKSCNSRAFGVALGVFALFGFLCGFIFCGGFFEGLSQSYITEFLKGKINGGFFSNAYVSFFSMGVFIVAGFCLGLSCISQPISFLLPTVKCIGGGIALSSFIEVYGILNGILAFCVFALPSFAIGTLISIYICGCAIRTSNRLFSYIRGKSPDTRPREFYSGYLSKGLISLAGCFLGGIVDAGISFLCGNFFII